MCVSPVYNSTMVKYRINQIVYIVQSCREIRQMKVIKYSNGFYTLRFLDTGGGIRLRESRIFATEGEAKKHVKFVSNSADETQNNDRYCDDYMYYS